MSHKHERELQPKRVASKAAARAIHKRELCNITEALKEFPGSTEKLIRNELDTLKKGGGTGGDVKKRLTMTEVMKSIDQIRATTHRDTCNVRTIT